MKTPEVYGGPYDGLLVPDTWVQNVVFVYAAKDSETMAIYWRRSDGAYTLDKLIHESEYYKMIGGGTCR